MYIGDVKRKRTEHVPNTCLIHFVLHSMARGEAEHGSTSPHSSPDLALEALRTFIIILYKFSDSEHKNIEIL